MSKDKSSGSKVMVEIIQNCNNLRFACYPFLPESLPREKSRISPLENLGKKPPRDGTLPVEGVSFVKSSRSSVLFQHPHVLRGTRPVPRRDGEGWT